MNKLTKSLLAIGVLAAALTAAASEPTDRIRDYQYDAGGNILRIGSDVFTYDRVDRVLTGTVNGRARAYTYDAFGNRRKCTDVASNSDCQYGATITASTNRIDGATYDDQGDLTQYAGQTYDYDEAGMLKRSPGGVEYIYTADDERIAVVTGTTWTWSMRDASGKVLREMTSSAGPGDVHVFQWSRDHVFRSGTLLSTIDPASGTRHYHTDHLGTPRVVSDTTGAVVGVHDYFAFGLEVEETLGEPNSARLKFTGHERDGSGLDYMHARYYGPKWGRFLSVDPVLDSEKALVEPQRWNRYAYVRNNPIGAFDPDGRDEIKFGKQTVTVFPGDVLVLSSPTARDHVAMYYSSGKGGEVYVFDSTFERNQNIGQITDRAKANLNLKDHTGDNHYEHDLKAETVNGKPNPFSPQRAVIVGVVRADRKVDVGKLVTAAMKVKMFWGEKQCTDYVKALAEAAGYKLRGIKDGTTTAEFIKVVGAKND